MNKEAERYKFQLSIDINTKDEKETGHVTIFDKENNNYVKNIPIEAENRKHLVEIAESIKAAFLKK